MTIPRRIDQPTDELFATHRPPVLADLPHLGGPTPIAQSSQTHVTEPTPRLERTPKSSHPAFAQFEETEFTDYERPTGRGRQRQTRYIDQAHIDHEWERHDSVVDEAAEPPERRGRSSAHLVQRQTQSRSSTRPTSGWRVVLSNAHSQLAHLAGIIVTAALVASAALLVVMMAGNREPNAQFDEFALPGFPVEAKDTLQQVDSVESVPLVESDLDPESLDVDSAGLAKESEVAPAETNAAVAEPVIEQIVEPTLPLGSLSFPTTHSPLALDYSKAMNDPAEGLFQLPVVAERETPQVNEQINR